MQQKVQSWFPPAAHCTEVRFVSFFSGGFTTMAVANPMERKLAKRISVHWCMTARQKLCLSTGNNICIMTVKHYKAVLSIVTIFLEGQSFYIALKHRYTTTLEETKWSQLYTNCNIS